MCNKNELRPTIFIVEDDRAVRNSLVFSLDLEGYASRPFASAHDLLNVKSFPERGCLVIDYCLPDMNGLQLLQRLRERNVMLPAILVTTEPSGMLRVRAAKVGAPIVEKPLLTGALSECIRACLWRAAID
jgi:FixJ family two-component response regulator